MGILNIFTFIRNFLYAFIVVFAISFFMLGGWSGALMNIFGIIRPEILRREKIAASKLTLYGLMLLLIISALAVIFFFDEKWYLILLVAIAQAAGTYFMWTQNGKNIRLCQLCIVSPLWLILKKTFAFTA